MSPITSLDVAGFNLTLVLQAHGGRGPKQLDIEGFVSVLHEPSFVEPERRLLSLRDQVSIVFQPPGVVVIDHSTADPVRERFIQTAIQVIEMLTSHGFAIPAYGWNVTGTISDVASIPAIHRLLNETLIEEKIGAGAGWLATQIRFVIPSTFADRTTVVLESTEVDDGEVRLMFSANAHLQRGPDTGQLEEEGARIWRDVAGLARNLVG